ncbi:hypothetical protein [Lentzea cavernae]|uniref:Uncharacterized protein n=1 Tax=Lentzea cavernae TaxID=2020703 RepID=A0ABQ3MIG6_9PSEU|nr:hypothetical protein [Lentzea cavernae]GHH44026.1 hypothetical protein GCM10017774_42780 [Lentzea cavernae]
MSVEVTPALRQAAHLMVLAQHLTRNPDLAPVNVHERGGDEAQQLQVRRGSAARMLVEWADSLIEPHACVRRIEDEAFVYVSGGAPAMQVEVWTTVPGLLEHLGWKPDEKTRLVAVEELRMFAAVEGVA